MSASRQFRRVGHSIITAGADLDQLAAHLEGATWDMVELDVLAHGDELIVAHSPNELDHPRPVRFADALRALRELLPEHVELDVDLKSVGYERAVLDILRSLDLIDRTLVSTMEASSLRVLRSEAPELRLGLSVPKARRDYLSNPLTRPAAYAMLAYLRRVMPRQAARAVSSGLADAIMAHWGVVTPALVQAVRGAGGELYVWTVDDTERLLTLHALGVSAVITNDRELFARAGLQPT
ncbi:MAG TPA: glycerophosphodiester phosphodiesterase [Solirubrobacteraceae bacterium]|nr:glycerophosphodiester phosphodiesterase [Solirubrobacteraceae bacterium]